MRSGSSDPTITPTGRQRVGCKGGRHSARLIAGAACVALSLAAPHAHAAPETLSATPDDATPAVGQEVTFILNLETRLPHAVTWARACTPEECVVHERHLHPCSLGAQALRDYLTYKSPNDLALRLNAGLPYTYQTTFAEPGTHRVDFYLETVRPGLTPCSRGPDVAWRATSLIHVEDAPAARGRSRSITRSPPLLRILRGSLPICSGGNGSSSRINPSRCVPCLSMSNAYRDTVGRRTGHHSLPA
jgi:plastocyanin